MLEIVLIIFGSYALLFGRYYLIPKRIVIGRRARLAGAALLLSPLLQVFYYQAYTYCATGTAIGPGDYAYYPNRDTCMWIISSLRHDQGLPIAFVCLLIAVCVSLTIAATAPKHAVLIRDGKGKTTSSFGLNATYSVENAATRLHLTPDQVLKLIEEGELNANWVNDTYEIIPSSLNHYLASERKANRWNIPPAANPFPDETYYPVSFYQPAPDGALTGNSATLKAYEYAVLQNPNNVDALLNRGRAYYGAGLTKQAVLDFTKVLQLQPDHPDAAALRGFIMQHSVSNSVTADSLNGGEQIRP